MEKENVSLNLLMKKNKVEIQKLSNKVDRMKNQMKVRTKQSKSKVLKCDLEINSLKGNEFIFGRNKSLN